MTASTWRIIIVILFIGHGLGHALALLAAAGLKLSSTHATGSWLFTPLLGDAATRILCVLAYLAALLLYVTAGLSLADWLVPQASWRTLAIAAALVSTAAIVLFWDGLPVLFPNRIGALAMNGATLISLLWLHWPPGLPGE